MQRKSSKRSVTFLHSALCILRCILRSAVPHRAAFLRGSAFCILTSALLVPAGCEQGGAVAGIIAQAIPRHIDAAYKGLANQNVIVMVWMDRQMRYDYPDVQLDLAASLQGKLITEAATEKPDCLKGTVFPVLASTVVRNQEDHPEWDNESITTTAAQFNGTRLIYLEVKEFATHAGAVELYRGTLKADLKVIEMKDGKAKIAFVENDISVDYPKDTPADGLPIGTEYSVAQGTIDAFTTQVAKRFYPHDEDRE